MVTEETKDYSRDFSVWIGRPVVMLVAIRQCLFPMPCRIVGESAIDVRIWLDRGWEVDVRKELIVAVEEAFIDREQFVN